MEDNKKAILLVEDQGIIAMMEKKELEKKGYTVYNVNSGKAAIQAIVDNDPVFDLILMDIDLGSDIDGTEAALEISKIKDIPVVFLSSHTEPGIVEKTENITSYGYVVKNAGIVVLDASIKMAFKLFNANMNTKLINKKLESTIENLRVHQVELQMQNEEMCEKQAEGEAWRVKYNDLYDKAPVGYFTLSESAMILDVNLTGADLLGVTRNALLNQQFSSFIVSEDQDIFYMHCKKLFDAGNPHFCELRMKRENCSFLPVYMKAVPVPGSNGSRVSRVVMIEDDTYQQEKTRRKAEREKEKIR